METSQHKKQNILGRLIILYQSWINNTDIYLYNCSLICIFILLLIEEEILFSIKSPLFANTQYTRRGHAFQCLENIKYTYIANILMRWQ